MRLRTTNQEGSVTRYRIVLAGLAVALVIAMAEGAMAANIVVNTPDDTPANDGFCTLREAILNANADNQSGSTDCLPGSGADTITFTTTSLTLLGTTLPGITSDVTIDRGIDNRCSGQFSASIRLVGRITYADQYGCLQRRKPGHPNSNEQQGRQHGVTLRRNHCQQRVRWRVYYPENTELPDYSPSPIARSPR